MNKFTANITLEIESRDCYINEMQFWLENVHLPIEGIPAGQPNIKVIKCEVTNTTNDNN